ncbi:hypothetical protein A2U01_0060074, partial [Trifolium medium]|nr:hypothetical protein [Trifolium medium]
LKPPKNTLFWELFARLRRATFLRESRQISPDLSAGEKLYATFSPALARLRRARCVVPSLFV